MVPASEIPLRVQKTYRRYSVTRRAPRNCKHTPRQASRPSFPLWAPYLGGLYTLKFPSKTILRPVSSDSNGGRYDPVEGAQRRRAPMPPAHVDQISSASNAYVKHCVKLRTSGGYRNEMGSLLVVGRVLLKEILESSDSIQSKSMVQALLLAESVSDKEAEELSSLTAARVFRVGDAVLRKIAGVQNVESLGMVAELHTPAPLQLSRLRDLEQGLRLKRVLALDGVQDPGNLGTLLRTTLALGWDGVILLPLCCDPFNDKALRAGRGAIFRMMYAHMTWEDLHDLAAMRNLQMVAAHPTAAPQTLDSFGPGGEQSDKNICLVMGSEGQGLSATAMETCTPVAIPMPGDMESLNVAVAGGILLYVMRPNIDESITR